MIVNYDYYTIWQVNILCEVKTVNTMMRQDGKEDL